VARCLAFRELVVGRLAFCAFHELVVHRLIFQKLATRHIDVTDVTADDEITKN
jgi:hypothetical protein